MKKQRQLQPVNENDIKKIFLMIKSEYPSAFNTLTEQMIEIKRRLWQQSLCVWDKQDVIQAVIYLLQQPLDHAPRIADVLKLLESIQTINDKTAIELWMDVKEELRVINEMSSYVGVVGCDNAREKIENYFNGLNPVIKAYFRNANEMMEVAEYDTETLSYEKARFLRYVPELMEKMKERETIEKVMKQLKTGKPLQELTGQRKELEDGSGNNTNNDSK